jgi:hypothetical protein
MKPSDYMTDEDIRHEKEKCLKDMVVMAGMAENWRKSYIRQARRDAPKDGYDGWEYMVLELSDEIETHAERFYKCGYMTKDEVWGWLAVVEEQEEILRHELEELAEEGRKLEREKHSLKARIKRKLIGWLQ